MIGQLQTEPWRDNRTAMRTLYLAHITQVKCPSSPIAGPIHIRSELTQVPDMGCRNSQLDPPRIASHHLHSTPMLTGRDRWHDWVDHRYYLTLILLSNRGPQARFGSNLTAPRELLRRDGKYLKDRTSVL
jgi:hypothetical protein